MNCVQIVTVVEIMGELGGNVFVIFLSAFAEYSKNPRIRTYNFGSQPD